MRKIGVLASIVLAIVSFAIPAVAQADPKWFDDVTEEFFPEEFHTELHMVGDLTVLLPAEVEIGPCEVTLGGLAVNQGNKADGTITNGKALQEHCPTNLGIPNCGATMTMGNLPWRVTGTTKIPNEQTGLEIQGITITLNFNKACGIAVPYSITGTGTPMSCMAECITFEFTEDDMKLEPPFAGLPAELGGTLMLTNPLTLQ